MKRNNYYLILLLIIVIILGIYAAFDLYQDRKEGFSREDIGQIAEEEPVFSEKSVKIINFLKLFVEKVLKAENEVSFENRLVLENAVRGIKDEQILAAWQLFVDGKEEKEIQQNLRDLLEILVNQI